MHESEESNIVRFVSGREIQDIVELYGYTSLEKLVHQAIKVESQVLKNTSFKNTHNDDSYKFSWNDKNKFQTKTFPSNFSKESTSQNRVFKDNSSTPKSPTKTSSRKCLNV